MLLFLLFDNLFLSVPNYLCQDPFLYLNYLQDYRFWPKINRSCISGLTCHLPGQKRESTLTEGVHELVAPLWPAGSVDKGRPAVVGLLVCRLGRRGRAIVLASAAGAVVIASRGALRVWGAAPTAAAHLLNNVHFSPQLWNKMAQVSTQQPFSRQHTESSVKGKPAKPPAMRNNLNSCFSIP